MKAKWLNREIVVSPIYYTLCTTEKLFRRELKSLSLPRKDWPGFLKNEHANATAHFIEHGETGDICCIVCTPHRKEIDPIVIAGLLVHEAVHIWQHIRDNIGEDKPSSEFEAYSVQRISQSLLAEYRRQVFDM